MALMIRCPLTGLPCGKPLKTQDKTFFLAEPEKPERDRERRGKAINEALGKEYRIRSALTEKQPIAFSCKICEMIQSCAYGMADITGQNPNVILELGMMFALGKPAIILCKKGQEKRLDLPSNLNAIEMVLFEEYIDIIGDLRDIAGSLPMPVSPPNPIDEIEKIRPLLAEELRNELKVVVKKFDKLAKEAKLETIPPRKEKVKIPPDLARRLSKQEEALRRLERLGLTTDAKTALYRGNFYHKRQQYEEALEQYDLCLTLEPDLPEALNNRGSTYGKMERYEEALADFNQALIIKPDYTDAINNRGNTYSKMARYKEALADYNQALIMEPDAPDILHNRGLTYAEMERYDEALADYNQALKIKPDFHEALNSRGITYSKMERYEEAISNFDQALKIKPDYPDAIYNKACLFSLMHKPKDAIALLEKAICLDEKYRQMATTDSDFDNIRDDPRFKKLIEGD